VETRGQDGGCVADQEVVWSEVFGQIGEEAVGDASRFAIDDEQAGLVAALAGRLCDQAFRK
jgi:hypothetical protein